MAFSLPVFNLTCNISTGTHPGGIPRGTSPCNLAFGRRIFTPATTQGWPVTAAGFFMQLLLPALTDIRSLHSAGTADSVEVPAGTGRWYDVIAVEDAGKGFANEHRVAWLLPLTGWPVPMP
jgi:hypothetical protein